MQGEYLDCLIAKAIVLTAQEHRASSIVLPDLGNIREIVQADVQAEAEQKVVGYLEEQRQYATS